MPTGFTPDTASGADQYRCFIMDVNFDRKHSSPKLKSCRSPSSSRIDVRSSSEMTEAVLNADGEDGTVGYPALVTHSLEVVAVMTMVSQHKLVLGYQN